ncbi:MAG TPA: hypothetical protein ENK24_02685 [Anaerolineae bacterium]|nr:hypothetical protein [Anaerolineae bacterium]
MWEVVAPFVLGYTAVSVALWNAIIIGIVLVVLGAWAALAEETTLKALNWVNALFGLWLIVAPFILTYAGVTAAIWNDIIVGIVVLVLAGWAALTVGGANLQHPKGHAA